MKILLAAPAAVATSGLAYGQIYPFLKFARSLKSALGVETIVASTEDLSEIAAACARHAHEVSAFVLRPGFHNDPGRVVKFFADLRTRHPNHRIVLLDPWDQCTGRYLGTLPYVDHLVKYQAYRDPATYQRDMIGGTLFTDYLAREQGFAMDGVNLGSRVDPRHAKRLMLGSYFNLTQRLHAQLRVPRVWPFYPARRDVDVVCHVSIGKRGDNSYYRHHRLQAVAAVDALAPQHVVVTSAEYDGERTVTPEQYRHDMRRSRIVVSPFGWGEVSTRDFEAAAYGNLLMRPRVDHVAVIPQIFIPGETYVPLEWDFRDLAEKVAYYRNHGDEAERMIRRARKACLDYYRQRQYLGWIAQALGIEPHREPADALALNRAANP